MSIFKKILCWLALGAVCFHLPPLPASPSNGGKKIIEGSYPQTEKSDPSPTEQSTPRSYLAKKNPFWVKGALGLKLKNKVITRGATTYGSFHPAPILFLAFLDDKIHFLGNSLEYRAFVYRDSWRLRGKIARVSDDPFLTLGDEKGFRNSRPTIWEGQVISEFFYPHYDHHRVQWDVSWTKDLDKSTGDLFETSLKVPLFNLGWDRDQMPLTTFRGVVTVGYGGSKFNQFYYGPEAQSAGFNYLELGIDMILPARFDHSYPAMRLGYSTLLGSQNKQGRLVRDSTDGIFLEMTFALGLFTL